MKKLVLGLASVLLMSVAFAQAPGTATPVAEMVKFKENVHDFGKIKQGVPVNYDFAFKNLSKKPLVIETAMASCGCTTPKWPQQPIGKGKSDKINAGFNAAAPGPFEKTITVKISGAAQPVELKIKGEVLSADAYAKYEAEKGKTNK